MAIDVDVSRLAKHQKVAGTASRLLERALQGGGEFAELFYEHTVQHDGNMRWALGRGIVVKPSVVQRIQEGLGVRVLDGSRCVFAFADGDAPEAWEQAAHAASRGGKRGFKPAPLGTHLDYTDLPADAPDVISEREKTALLREAVDAACSLDDRVQHIAVRYHDHIRRITIATSEGKLMTQATPLVGLRIAVTLATPDDPLTTHAVTGSAGGFGHFFEHPPAHLAREAVKQAQRLAHAKPLPAGRMPVVLAAGWGGVWLHEAIGHTLEADTGLLAGQQGDRIAADLITLVDDATLPGGRGTFAFDDEGTPAARTTLVENGILRALLTDRRHSSLHTGNGRCQSYQHAPLPRMTNLLLLPGETEPDDLIAEVRDGLYVTAIGNGCVQPKVGFSVDVLEGFRIEQGRLTTPVTNVKIVGNGVEMLRNVVGVGRDFKLDTGRGWCEKAGQVVPVSVGMPTVLIRGMELQPT